MDGGAIWAGQQNSRNRGENAKDRGNPRRRVMLIQSLKHHFPARLLEWFMALFFMVPWGVYMIMWERPETAPLLKGMADMVIWTGYHPSAVWGLAAILVGMIRAAASSSTALIPARPPFA